MDIYVFNSLAIDERAQYAWKFGTFLKSVNKDRKRYALYHTPDFYIRIEYDYEVDSITQVKAFKSDIPTDKLVNDCDEINRLSDEVA